MSDKSYGWAEFVAVYVFIIGGALFVGAMFAFVLLAIFDAISSPGMRVAFISLWIIALLLVAVRLVQSTREHRRIEREARELAARGSASLKALFEAKDGWSFAPRKDGDR